MRRPLPISGSGMQRRASHAPGRLSSQLAASANAASDKGESASTSGTGPVAFVVAWFAGLMKRIKRLLDFIMMCSVIFLMSFAEHRWLTDMYIMSTNTEEGIYKLVRQAKRQLCRLLTIWYLIMTSSCGCSGQEISSQGPVNLRRSLPMLQERADQGVGGRGGRCSVNLLSPHDEKLFPTPFTSP